MTLDDDLKKEKTIKNFWKSNSGKFFLAVPKNLIRFGIVIILLAFVTMIYIINTDNNFFETSDIEAMLKDPINEKIHPFYRFMQAKIDTRHSV